MPRVNGLVIKGICDFAAERLRGCEIAMKTASHARNSVTSS